MIELYNKSPFRGLLRYILLCSALLIVGGDMYGQELKIRKSNKAPAPYTNVDQYKLQGDFMMIGNTNQYYTNFNPNQDNKQPTIYIDVDNDPTTLNSSMAEIKLPSGSCSEIIYAGLYWVASSIRYDDVGTVKINHGGKTWDLNRYKVKLKHHSQNTYLDINADSRLIDSENLYNIMYSAYADVTDYVRTYGEGQYFVANIAEELTDIDKIGAWGMVIIYRNTAMTWKNISVFDGYWFMASKETAFTRELVISGFKTPIAGNFKVSMGYIAGEGDRIAKGDFLAIRNATNTNWVKLNHEANTIDNFFNSTIYPDSFNRNPKYVDNVGIDIGKFELPNTNNALINNNATSTIIQAGTIGDGYFINNMVFAVDSYQTDIIAENKIISGAVDNGTVGPGQELVWDLTIRNAGNEAIGDGLIEIPIPPSLHYVSSSVDQTKDVKGTVTWTPPAGAIGTDPSKTPGGKLVWKFDKDVPLADITKVLGKITYKLKVVDCMILSTTANNCMKGLEFNGTVGGIGKVTGENLNLPLVKIPGICGDRDDDDFRLNFNVPACPGVVNSTKIYEEYCIPTNSIKRATIIGDYPPGTKFYSVVPGTANYLTSEVKGDFPATGTATMYYAIAPGTAETCYMKLSTINKGVTTSPVVNNVSFCLDQPIVLNNQPSKAGLKLYYYDSATATIPTLTPPAPKTVGVHTYYVAEGEFINGADCIGPRKPFTITVFALPSVITVLGPIDLCVNMDYKVTISVDNAIEHWIEYTLPSAPTVWKRHDANSFPNGQLSFKVGGILTFTNVTKDLDKVTLRVAVKSTNGCIVYSNPFPVTVTDCGGIVNPMLLTPAGK